jgi:hypothetical protein
VGDELRVQLVDRDLVGRFETLDANGALVLRLRDRIATIAAGDVFLSQASPSGTAA